MKPYLIDLKSTHGTFLNHKKIDDSRYIELMEKDVVRFGASTREYVLMKDKDGQKIVRAPEGSDAEPEEDAAAEKDKR